LRILHNNTAKKINDVQSKNEKALQKTLQNLSSGLKVNSAADDAAGLAISQGMKRMIGGLSKAYDNAQEGIALLQTADGALGEIQSSLQDMNKLSVEAANGTLTDADRTNINNEVEKLKQSIDQIANGTNYNTLKLLQSEDIIETSTYETPVTYSVPTVTMQSTGLTVPDLSTLTSAQLSSIKADVVFVVDHTGSMAGNIQSVEDNIDGVINQIGSLNFSLGLVTYSDDSIDSYDLGMTPSDFKSTLGSLTADGSTEYTLESVMDADKLSFRSGAQKHIIVITDESGDSRTSDTMSSVTAQLSADNIKTDVICPDSLASNFQPLTSGTSGRQINLYDPVFRQSLYDILGDIVNEATGTTVPTKTITETVPVSGFTTVNSYETGTIETASPLYLQIGADQDQTMHIRLCDAGTGALGVADLSTSTQAQAQAAIDKIGDAISTVSSYRSRFGAYQNRLNHVKNLLSTETENTQAAMSAITDADMAKEMTEYTKLNILQQSSNAMLAQAQQLPQSTLSLLKQS
jgi:flagellin